MKNRIFLDMDGVLCKWENKSIEEVTSPGYFRNLMPIKNIIDMARMLLVNDCYDIYTLSAVFIDNHSIMEKKEWLDVHFNNMLPEKRIFVPYGSRKSKYVDQSIGLRNNDILIDDFTKNLREWHGIGIKVYNGINGTKGTWDGYSIHSNMLPENMAKQVIGIVKQN